MDTLERPAWHRESLGKQTRLWPSRISTTPLYWKDICTDAVLHVVPRGPFLMQIIFTVVTTTCTDPIKARKQMRSSHGILLIQNLLWTCNLLLDQMVSVQTDYLIKAWTQSWRQSTLKLYSVWTCNNFNTSMQSADDGTMPDRSDISIPV